MDTVQRKKEALRAALLTRRKAIAARAKGAAQGLADRFGDAVPLPPNTAVSGYVPIKNEIDIGPQLDTLRGAGHEILLPVTPAAPGPLVFKRWGEDDALSPGPLGTREPAADAPDGTPGVLIVPMLGFDRRGRRLGYGGGFYDRTIAALRCDREILAVGVAYAEQEIARVPCRPGDQRVDWVVTEREAISVREGLRRNG